VDWDKVRDDGLFLLIIAKDWCVEKARELYVLTEEEELDIQRQLENQ
jgi:hypothetical protein